MMLHHTTPFQQMEPHEPLDTLSLFQRKVLRRTKVLSSPALTITSMTRHDTQNVLNHPHPLRNSICGI